MSGCATPPFRIPYALYAPPESWFRVVITGHMMITGMYPEVYNGILDGPAEDQESQLPMRI
eukprot:6093964-Pyramimonas_sp.AAC.1